MSSPSTSKSNEALAPVAIPTFPTATTAFTEAVVAIRTQLTELTENDIRERYRIGHQLNEIVSDTTGKYGKHPRRQLQQVMPLSRDGLRPMMVLAATHKADEIEALLELRHPTTAEGLTWTHMASLSRLQDRTQELAFAQRSVEAGWSTKELNRAILASQGRRSQGGRKPKKSTSFVACLADIEAKSTLWINACRASWQAPSGGLEELYRKTSQTGFISTENLAALEKTTLLADELLVHVRSVQYQISILVQRARASRVSRNSAA